MMKKLLTLIGLLGCVALPTQGQVIVESTEAYAATSPEAQHIAARLEYYVPLMGLEGWRIHILVEDVSNKHTSTSASTSALPQYRSAHIIFYQSVLEQMQKEHREEIYRHELFHLLLWPIGGALTDRYCCEGEAFRTMMYLRESVATNLARMEVWNEQR